MTVVLITIFVMPVLYCWLQELKHLNWHLKGRPTSVLSLGRTEQNLGFG